MINYTTLASCFTGIVGFRPSNQAGLETYDPALTGSTYSCYVTDIPGMTPETIQYAKSPDYSTVSAYLIDVRAQETNNAIKDFVKNHKELTNARSFYENISIAQEKQYHEDTPVAKAGRFVGLYFKITGGEQVAAHIKRIGCQFTSLQNGLRIYLYESSQVAAIKTFDLTSTKINSLQWFDLTDFLVYYRSLTGGTAQDFYLGYFEDDLAGSAVDTKLYGSCDSCGPTYPSGMRDLMDVSGVVFENSALSGTGCPDLRQIGYTDQTFGIHAKVNVVCDITEVLCDQKILFDKLIQRKIAIRIFWDFYNSNRVNRASDIARNNALTNIQREEELYKSELKALSLDFTDIDRYCLPCNKQMLTVASLS